MIIIIMTITTIESIATIVRIEMIATIAIMRQMTTKKITIIKKLIKVHKNCCKISRIINNNEIK